MDGWFTSIAAFMAASGSLSTVPPAKNYIDESFMEQVRSDPKLAAFATSTK